MSSPAWMSKKPFEEPFCKPDCLDLDKSDSFYLLIFFLPWLGHPKILNTEVCGFASVSGHAKMCLKSEYIRFSDANFF